MNLSRKFASNRTLAAGLGFALSLGFLGAPDALAQEQTKDQQKCIGSMAGYVVRINLTQARENAGCVKDYGKDKLGAQTVAECLEADRKERMLKLEAKIQEKQTDPDKGKCIGAAEPDFAFVSAAAMVAGVQPEQVAALADILGATPETLIVDATDRANRDAATCQNTILKTADKITATELKGFKSCVGKGLRARTDAFSSAADLETCIDDVKLAERADKAEAKLVKMIGKKCTEKGIDWDTVVGGACAAEADPTAYAACIRTAANCTACLEINGGYGLAIDCDLYDDGVANSTCGGAPSPRGAFVDGPILF
ncbi:MAG: hypothetical protein VCC00_02945 [Deltaproteobacteria bacterium]